MSAIPWFSHFIYRDAYQTKQPDRVGQFIGVVGEMMDRQPLRRIEAFFPTLPEALSWAKRTADDLVGGRSTRIGHYRGLKNRKNYFLHE